MKGIAAAALLLAAMTTAAAGESGFFVGAGAGVAKTTPASLVSSSWTFDWSDMTATIGGGYRFNRYFGLEGGYRRLGTIVASGSQTRSYPIGANVTSTSRSSNGTLVMTLPNGGTAIDEERQAYDTSAFSFGTFAAYPLTKTIEISARAGLHAWSVEISTDHVVSFSDSSSRYTWDGKTPKITGTESYFGFGLSRSIGDRTSISLNWTRFKFSYRDTDLAHTDTFDVGVQYRF